MNHELRPSGPEAEGLLPACLHFPGTTLAGRGVLATLGVTLESWGPRGLVLHGRALDLHERRDAFLQGFSHPSRIRLQRHPGGEPTLDQVDALRQQAREIGVDWMAAIGGGSVLDLAKAAAGLLDAPHPVRTYHRGAPIPSARIPFAAVPTTAGTGSEATSVAVLTDDDAGLKQSIRHPSFMPRVVGLDPELLRDCPPGILAAAGMDAFTQALESALSRHATTFSRRLSETALQAIAQALPAVFRDGADADPGMRPARHLLEGSYLAGLALSHARLGIVHGLAHPIGVRLGAPHGLVCALCLPAALEFNRPACPDAFRRLEAILGEAPETLVDRWLHAFSLAWPAWEGRLDDIEAIVNETLASGSTAANPRPANRAEIRGLLQRIFTA